MSLLEDFARVSARMRCPVCGKSDWCLVSREGGASPARAICKRTESAIRWGEAGWLHVLRGPLGGNPAARKHAIVRSLAVVDANLAALCCTLQRRLDPDRLHQLARDLGLPPEPLRRLRVGQAVGDELRELGLRSAAVAWTFPMCDPLGDVIGVRVRLPNGKKLCVKGSRQGLFIPTDLEAGVERLFIAEGESDTAALLALGLDAFGRPSARCGSSMALRLVRRLEPAEVVVVADADEVGQRGAHELAAMLRVVHALVRTVTPPEGIKDARQWVMRGADASDIKRRISAPLGLASISVRVGGRS